MSKMILRCTEECEEGALSGTPAHEAFIHGYNIAERSLEGVAIRVFHTPAGGLDAEICLPDARLKSLFIDKEEVLREVLEWIEGGHFDVLASTRDLCDDHMMIYDPSLPNDAQACRVSPSFTVRSKV